MHNQFLVAYETTLVSSQHETTVVRRSEEEDEKTHGEHREGVEE
jgi:hypothetical protein